MDRRNPTQHGPVAVLVTCVLVVSVAAVGVTQASAEINGGQPLNITDSGDSQDLYSFENRHNVSNIKIAANSGVSSDEYLTLYINLIELQNAKVNVSEVVVQDSKITNGQVVATNKSRNNGEVIVRIQIKQLDNNNPIQVDSVQLSGLNSSNGKITENIQYRIGAMTTNSTSGYDDLEAGGYTRNSTGFDLISGSIIVRDQATMSSNFHKSSRTSSGVTVSEIISNVNSTIVLTNKENSRIVGHRSQTVQDMRNNNEISLETTILGGDIGIYLIPNNKTESEQIDTSEYLSDQLKQSAIAADRSRVYLGTVQFNNQQYETGGVSNLSVTTAEVRDDAGLNTPYIVSIHPLNADGEIMYDRYVGYSDVLVGVNDDLMIPVRSTRGSRETIWHSNRFVGIIQLAPGQAVGERVDLNSTDRLPNSDINEQFVDGGVSDGSHIRISNVKWNQNNSNKIIYPFNTTNYNRDQLYSGSVIGFENRTSQENSVELHRSIEDNRSVIAGLGTYSNTTDRVLFNTTGLQTGTYYLSGGGFKKENQFKVIGRNEQKADLINVSRKLNIGANISYELYHNTSDISLRFSDSNTNNTFATANLSTPTPGRTEISLNTYALGNESLTDGFITAGPNATVESVETSVSNGTLPPGEYRIEVRSEQGLATTADVATVEIGTRSTNGMHAYASNDLDPDDLGTADAVRQAIEDGTLSPTSTVTSNETVAYVVNATGLTGVPAARNATVETGSDLAELDGLAFDVRSNESETATGDNESDPRNAIPRESSVHVDEEGLYLVAEGDDALATNGTPADGEAFTAEFRVADERLREAASDPMGNHSASTTVTFEAQPSNSTDSDPVSDDPLGGGDGSRGDSGTGNGGTGGGTSGGSGGGGTSGGSDGGSQAGGGGAAGEGGATGRGGTIGDAPNAGSSPNGSEADNAENGSSGETRLTIGKDAGRFGTRRVPGLRSGARDDSTGSPVSVLPVGDGPGERGVGSFRSDASRRDARVDSANAGGDTASGTADREAEIRASDAPAAESETEAGERETPSYEDAPIRTTADDVPGFGPVVTVVALLLAGKFAARRRGS